jgi:hypothetical protein
MSTTPARTPPAAAPAPPAAPVALTGAQLVSYLVELERQPMPADTLVSQRASAKWVDDHWITAELEPYRGEMVAVLDGAVVAHGADPHQLELDVVRRFGVHPARMVIVYIPQWGEAFNR